MRSASFVLPASSFLPVPGTWCRARYGSGTCCAYLLFFSERDALTLAYRYLIVFFPVFVLFFLFIVFFSVYFFDCGAGYR